MTQEILEHATSCFSCAAKVKLTLGDLEYTRENYQIIVTGVPMSICEECGERSVPGPVGIAIGDIVAEFAESIERVLAHSDITQSASFHIHASERLGNLVPSFA